jgi:hypothetical protein
MGNVPESTTRAGQRRLGPAIVLVGLLCAGFVASGLAMPWQSQGDAKKQPQKQTQKKAAEQPAATFHGRLKFIDSKSIVLTLDENRELEFKRTSRTKFFRDGKEITTPNYAPGSILSVDATMDPFASFVAESVAWNKASQGSDANAKGSAPVVDAWAMELPKEPATEKRPPASKPTADDPGRPVLRRQAPADRSREQAKAPPESPTPGAWVIPSPESDAASMPPPPSMDETEPASAPQRDDPVIRRAADAAMDYIESLPDYTTQQVITRYVSQTARTDWKALDVVTTDVVYDDGKEQYRNVKVGGKKVESLEKTHGAWSTGEFGSIMISLFAPATRTEFHFNRTARIANINASVYSYRVAKEYSSWTVDAETKTYRPGYEGSVWIDPSSFKVLRIEMAAVDLPSDFPLAKVESATDYDYILLGGTQRYLLPVHAEMLSCQRNSTICSRNVIEFRNYHKYTSESTVTFGDSVEK